LKGERLGECAYVERKHFHWHKEMRRGIVGWVGPLVGYCDN